MLAFVTRPRPNRYGGYCLFYKSLRIKEIERFGVRRIGRTDIALRIGDKYRLAKESASTAAFQTRSVEHLVRKSTLVIKYLDELRRNNTVKVNALSFVNDTVAVYLVIVRDLSAVNESVAVRVNVREDGCHVHRFIKVHTRLLQYAVAREINIVACGKLLEGFRIVLGKSLERNAREVRLIAEIPVLIAMVEEIRLVLSMDISSHVLNAYLALPGRAVVGAKVEEGV